MENKEKIVSRDTLMTKLWESDSFVDENTLSVNGKAAEKAGCGRTSGFYFDKERNRVSYRVGDVDEAENRGSYIKCRLKWIAAVIGCGIVMTAVLFLNEVPAGEIAYGMLLCLGILLFAVTMDGISYGRRHRELFALQQSITVSLENLPEPGEILEEDYQQLLGLLAEEKMRIWNTAVSEKRGSDGILYHVGASDQDADCGAKAFNRGGSGYSR